ELHSCAAQIHLVEYRAREAAHSAMRVANVCTKQHIQNATQNRIPNVFVVPGHSAGFDLAAKTVPHHNVESLARRFDKTRYFREVIAVVRIAHHDKRAARGTNSCLQCRAVTLLLSVHDTRT